MALFEPWIHIDKIKKVIDASLAMKWCWGLNTKCKYITVTIDMRDGGCRLFDRDGNEITIEELQFQHNKQNNGEE